MKKLLIFILVLCLAGSPLSAEETKLVIARYLVVGNSTYPYSPKGARMYLNEIRNTNPGVYKQLEPIVGKMERDSFLSTVTFGAGFILLSVAIGMVMANDKMDDQAAVKGMFAGGGGLMLFGMGYRGYVVLNNEAEILRFINMHNRLNPGNPIRIQ